MNKIDKRSIDGQFVVVETDEETYLGVASFPSPDTLKISTGFSGRPVLLSVLDVDLIEPAEGHPEVIPA